MLVPSGQAAMVRACTVVAYHTETSRLNNASLEVALQLSAIKVAPNEDDAVLALLACLPRLPNAFST